MASIHHILWGAYTDGSFWEVVSYGQGANPGDGHMRFYVHVCI